MNMIKKLAKLILLALLIAGLFSASMPAVIGAGGDPFDINISPKPVDFGAVKVGSSGVKQTVTIRNDGIDVLGIGGLLILGADAADFSKENDYASSQTIAPGASVSLDIVFSPNTSGSKSATLSIQMYKIDKSESASIDVRLIGTTQAPPPEPVIIYPPGFQEDSSPVNGSPPALMSLPPPPPVAPPERELFGIMFYAPSLGGVVLVSLIYLLSRRKHD